MKLLQINYQLNSAVSDFLQESRPAAIAIANIPGLKWKIWLMNETDDQGGGIYLFDNAEARTSFINGPIIAKLKSHPSVRNVSIKEFDISEDLSSTTRAPI